MKARQSRAGQSGFTLIEMMIAVAMVGIITVWLIPAVTQVQKMSGSEVALQQAIRALQNETELLKAMPHEELRAGEVRPFDSRNRALAQLPGAIGEIMVEADPDLPGLLVLKVTVRFTDPRQGERSIHSELLRAP